MLMKLKELVRTNKVTLMEIYKRYGHISIKNLKSLVEINQKYHVKTPLKCEVCKGSKSKNTAVRAN